MKKILFLLSFLVSVAYGQNIHLPATTSLPGMVSTLPNDATKFWNGIGAYSVPPGTYVLPTASTSVLGGVKIDGSTISISGGVISSLAGLPNPGVYFSPAQALDPSFIVFASAIISISNSYVFHDLIQWQILGQASGHNSSFIDTVRGDPSTHSINVVYPHVKTVINYTITNDESTSGIGIFAGPSVGLDSARVPIFQFAPLGWRLTGNGSGTWSVSSASSSSISLSTFSTSTGLTGFNFNNSAAYNASGDGFTVMYSGPNNWHVQRVYSGLGIYGSGFRLVDAGGNAVLTNPSTSDEIIINGTFSVQLPVNAYQYDASNVNWGTSYNFWSFGLFECWMVAAPIPGATGQINVKWQTFPSATAYKIYRATTPNFASPTLIYSGTNLSFLDTGLSSGTLYYYKEVVTVSGVDGTVTTFTSSAN